MSVVVVSRLFQQATVVKSTDYTKSLNKSGITNIEEFKG